MLEIRHLASLCLFLFVVVGMQSCGMESPEFNSEVEEQGTSVPDNGSSDDNSDNDGSSGSDSDNQNPNIQAGLEIYIDDCAGCHGDSGQGTQAAGALTNATACVVCSDFDDLVEEILTTMPLGNADGCDQDCSEKVAEYIWVSLLSNDPVSNDDDSSGDGSGDDNSAGDDDSSGDDTGDDNSAGDDDSSGDGSGDDNSAGGDGGSADQLVSGQQYYEAKCTGCHGSEGQGGLADIDPTKTIYEDEGTEYRVLSEYIATVMSPKVSDGCTGDCADDIAAYIRSWVEQDSGDDSADAGICEGVTYGPRTIRVLTKNEFSNSIEDLTGINIEEDIGSSFFDAIPADNLLDGFSNNTMATVDSGALQSYEMVVNKVVELLADDDYSTISSCSDADSCTTDVIDNYLPKVFRRPLTDDEKTLYQAMFDVSYTEGDVNEGFELAMKTMLTSPQFLYRDETGVAVASLQDGGSGDTDYDASDEVQILVDGSETLTLADYEYQGFDNKSFTGKDLVVISARNTSSNAAVTLSIKVGSVTEEIAVADTAYKTYEVLIEDVAGDYNHVGVQPASGSIEINSLTISQAVEQDDQVTQPAVELDDDAYVLTAYQLASYLAYTFTGSTPDDTLLAAAGNGELETDEQIAAQVERLLLTDRARQHFGDFAAQWLRTDGVLNTTKSETVYPEFTTAVRQAMSQEVRALFNHVVLDEGEAFETLFNGRYTFVNEALADFYGLSGVSGEAMTKVSTNNRAGLVTSGAFMAVHAHEEDTGPILRATYLRRRMLCHYVPAPPTGVSLTNDGEVDFDAERQAAIDRLNEYLEIHGEVTSRLKYETQTSASSCQTCHEEMINPLGFGFEDFDSVGLPQTKDFNDLDVDASGALYGVTAVNDGEVIYFNGAKELADSIATLDVTRQCFVENSFRMAMGTGSTYIDRLIDIELSDDEVENYSCAVNKLDSVMTAAGNSPLELLKALGTMDSVRYRKDVTR